jgi:hypothetical protein
MSPKALCVKNLVPKVALLGNAMDFWRWDLVRDPWVIEGMNAFVRDGGTLAPFSLFLLLAIR